MSNKYKKRVRALAAKLGVSYQAADNLLKAGRRSGAGSEAASDRAEVEDLWIGYDASKVDEVVVDGYPAVALWTAGWSALLENRGTVRLLLAVAEGVTEKGIERALTRWVGRTRLMSLRESRLLWGGAPRKERLDAVARLAGHEPPTTFGDLLLLMVRLGIVKEEAGRYTVAFPPPAPEETLPLTSEQFAKVMWFRTDAVDLRQQQLLRACVDAQGPGFVAPAWMRVLPNWKV